MAVADALVSGGLDAIEFTMTTPGALRTLEEASGRLGDHVVLGAGTVLDAETARLAIMSGARFIVSPTLDEQVVRMCHRYDVACVPGAFSPSEALRAWEMGADLVKIFPATSLGPSYVKDLLAPLPQLRLIPTGGVSLENVPSFVRAGATAVAVGRSLVDPELVASTQFGKIAEVAGAFREAVANARRSLEPSVPSSGCGVDKDRP
jgi:2-dehydro-3-deoxyphosphogluconate aldolase/(4S)-4-hydroxy-2-oxoglutarate aldolase